MEQDYGPNLCWYYMYTKKLAFVACNVSDSTIFFKNVQTLTNKNNRFTNDVLKYGVAYFDAIENFMNTRNYTKKTLMDYDLLTNLTTL